MLLKRFETQESTLTGLQFFASVEPTFFKIGVIASFNSFGKFFCMINCSIHIFSDIHKLFQRTLSRF